jgi:hypothetical protein
MYLSIMMSAAFIIKKPYPGYVPLGYDLEILKKNPNKLVLLAKNVHPS